MPGKRQPSMEVTVFRLTDSSNRFRDSKLSITSWGGLLVIVAARGKGKREMPSERSQMRDDVQAFLNTRESETKIALAYHFIEPDKRGAWLKRMMSLKGDEMEVADFDLVEARSEPRLISKAQQKVAKWEKDHPCEGAGGQLFITPICRNRAERIP